MNKLAATLGVFALGGNPSLCDLCETASSAQRGTTHALISVAGSGTPVAPGYARRATAPGVASLPAPVTKTVALSIQGMTCGGCVFAVRKVLSRLPGVSKADVSYEKSRALVTYDPGVVTTAQMVAAIKTLGYTATVEALTPP